MAGGPRTILQVLTIAGTGGMAMPSMVPLKPLQRPPAHMKDLLMESHQVNKPLKDLSYEPLKNLNV